MRENQVRDLESGFPKLSNFLSGVRNLEKLIEKIFRKAAFKVCGRKREVCLFSCFDAACEQLGQEDPSHGVESEGLHGENVFLLKLDFGTRILWGRQCGGSSSLVFFFFFCCFTLVSELT